ncbi:MAG: hypothetical protein M3548_18470 [Actinomycetota bacterium]|nr:hypothetical protein [Actinomycetota bacterium]
MGAFVDTVLRFPVVLFTFLLVVVIVFWLLVLAGAFDADSVDSGDGFADGLGFGTVPLSIALSLMIVVAWFLSLVATVFIQDAALSPPITLVLSIAALLAALVAALLVTRIVVLPLRRLFPEANVASRNDFVGLPCVVRTGSVDLTFGQAEVTAADGSSAIVQVRKAGDDPLRAGGTAVIYDYDPVGEFFWISPMDTALPTPDSPTA